MTNSKNRAELKAQLKEKTNKLVSKDKELFVNLSKKGITEKKKERAKEFRKENKELLDQYKTVKEKLINIDIPEILTRLDLQGHENKFVHMLDENGREYLIAFPINEYGYHNDIVKFAEEHFKKRFMVMGGGYIKKEGNSLKLYGKSDVFGEANMYRVKVLLEKQFPNTDVEYDGKEKHFDLSTERRNIKNSIKDKEVKKEGLSLLGDNPEFYSSIMEREAKKGLGKDYMEKVLHIYSSINFNGEMYRFDLDEKNVRKCLNEYGPKLGYDHVDKVIFPKDSNDICVAVRSVENGIDYGYSAVYIVWRPEIENSYNYPDFYLFKEIANTKETKDYLSVNDVVLDKENDVLKLNISTGGSYGGNAISKSIEIDLQKELDPRTEETNRFKIEKEYKGFSGKERLEHITNDLEDAGYLSDLDGEKINFLDVAEYDKKAIFEKLEAQKLTGRVAKHLDYKTPKAKSLKIVMLKFDRDKDKDLTETNFIEEMKKFGVRPIKFEEYLQFVSNNSKYLKNQKRYIYMPEKVVSSEGYVGRLQAHHNGIGIDINRSMYQAQFPFVIEE